MSQTTNQYILGDKHPFSSDFGVHQGFWLVFDPCKKVVATFLVQRKFITHAISKHQTQTTRNTLPKKTFPERYDFQRDPKNLGWLPSKQMRKTTHPVSHTMDPRWSTPHCSAPPNFSVAQEALKILRKMAENDVTMSLIAAQMEPIEAQKPIQRYIYQWARQ